jgi:hypothetical protein
LLQTLTSQASLGPLLSREERERNVEVGGLHLQFRFLGRCRVTVVPSPGSDMSSIEPP